MQATILHMVQSAQIGCTTPASEYNLFIYLLLHLLPIFFCFAFLITLWTFWHALHARESFFTACRPPTHSPCSPVSDGIDDVQRRGKSCPSIERERAKTYRDRRSAYPTTTSISSLRVCFLACLLCLFVSAFAGGDAMLAERGGYILRGGIIIDDIEIFGGGPSGSKRSTWTRRLWSHVHTYISNSNLLAELHLCQFFTIIVVVLCSIFNLSLSSYIGTDDLVLVIKTRWCEITLSSLIYTPRG